MTKLKYKLLQHVHNSSVIHPATRMDFYKRKGKANQYKLAIDELIQRKYLSEEVSTGILTITSPGVDALEAEQERIFLFRWDFFRYAVTTVIAIAALVMSIISYVSR